MNDTTITTIEDIPTSLTITEACQWYAAHEPQIRTLKSGLWALEKRVREYVREFGPVRTPSGTIEMLPDGLDYDADGIAEHFPDCIVGVKVTSEMDLATYHKLIESAAGLGITLTPEWIPDKRAAKSVLKHGTSQARELMGRFIKERGKLGVAK